MSLDYLLSDSADAPEQNRRISNEPDGEMVTISDSADGGKKGKQKTAKWLAILMVVVALITVIVITYLNQKETEPIEQNMNKAIPPSLARQSSRRMNGKTKIWEDAMMHPH